MDEDYWVNGKVFVLLGTIGVDYKRTDHSIGDSKLAEDVSIVAVEDGGDLKAMEISFLNFLVQRNHRMRKGLTFDLRHL